MSVLILSPLIKMCYILHLQPENYFQIPFNCVLILKIKQKQTFLHCKMHFPNNFIQKLTILILSK